MLKLTSSYRSPLNVVIASYGRRTTLGCCCSSRTFYCPSSKWVLSSCLAVLVVATAVMVEGLVVDRRTGLLGVLQMGRVDASSHHPLSFVSAPHSSLITTSSSPSSSSPVSLHKSPSTEPSRHFRRYLPSYPTGPSAATGSFGDASSVALGSTTETTSEVSAAATATSTSSSKLHKLDGREILGDLRPIYDKMVVLPKEAPRMSAGGLLLSTDSRPQMAIGKVLSVGTGYVSHNNGLKLPMDVSTGNWILYDSNDGQAIDYDGNECVVLGSREVLAVVQADEGVATPLNVKPLLDLVLLKLQDTQDVTSSGLVLSMGQKEGAYNGEVIAVGEGAYDLTGKRMPIEVSTGDHVRLSSNAYRGGDGRGDKMLKFGNDKYVFVRANELLVKW